MMAQEENGEATNPFVPVAKYYSAMDMVLLVREDCSYRADRVDAFLTLLWHLYEERLIGIKLKGMRYLFEQMRTILDLKDEDFLPLIKIIQVAMVGVMAQPTLDDIS